MRLFAAVRVSPQVAQNLSHFIERLKLNPEFPPKTKWVEEEHYHFTLKFFGEIADSQVPALEEALEKAVHNQKKFEINLKGLGGFPELTHPRVVWAGVESGTQEFENIATAIEKETVKAGFPATDKPFSAHLTIARLNHPARPGLPKVLEKHTEAEFGAMAIDHLCLIQSTLNIQGSQYTERRRWSFK